ncbi:hypothetical protein FD755_013599 [Muntiacus reevesi]|uniref:Uncharacterized protein n=1 Tax=Muntiacus reevesi TaxID=9886 RepID=A0A5N3XMG0_MUNRE|nr:hypothetical protein FD755_013599 [Muntiacus reevesi]
MGRGRSRSPQRELRWSRSTSREGECRRQERRFKSPRRHRSTFPSPSQLKERRDEKKETKRRNRERNRNDELMGFASFDSTKGKKVMALWIQQNFGFHCMRTEVLKNDLFSLILIRTVDFVFNMHQKQDHSPSSL